MARLLEQLAKLHESNVCHGDLRLYNMVFGRECSWLIVFDFAGESGEARYPLGYNRDLPDGRRHPNARAGEKLQKAHDLYSMAECMRQADCESQVEAQREQASRMGEHGQY